jgi:hypothetical protein
LGIGRQTTNNDQAYEKEWDSAHGSPHVMVSFL